MEEMTLIERRLRELADALAEHNKRIASEEEPGETTTVLSATAPAHLT